MEGKQEQKGPEGRRVETFTLELGKGGPTLFNNRLCPYGHRAWWAALEKNLEFDYIHVDLGPEQPASYAVICLAYLSLCAFLTKLFLGDQPLRERALLL